MNTHLASASRLLPSLLLFIFVITLAGCTSGQVQEGAPAPKAVSPSPAAQEVGAAEPAAETAVGNDFWDQVDSKADPGPRAVKTSGQRGGVISRWARARRGEQLPSASEAPSEPESPPPLNVEKLRGEPKSVEETTGQEPAEAEKEAIEQSVEEAGAEPTGDARADVEPPPDQEAAPESTEAVPEMQPESSEPVETPEASEPVKEPEPEAGAEPAPAPEPEADMTPPGGAEPEAEPEPEPESSAEPAPAPEPDAGTPDPEVEPDATPKSGDDAGGGGDGSGDVDELLKELEGKSEK